LIHQIDMTKVIQPSKNSQVTTQCSFTHLARMNSRIDWF